MASRSSRPVAAYVLTAVLYWYAAILGVCAIWQAVGFVTEFAGNPPNPSAPAFQASMTVLSGVLCAITALAGRLASRPRRRSGGGPTLPRPGGPLRQGPSPVRVLGLGLILTGTAAGVVLGILLGLEAFTTLWVGARPGEWMDVLSLLMILWWLPVMVVATVAGTGVWLRRAPR